MTNPITPTDRTFLRHFSMVIGFLVVVMFALIGFALYLYDKHPPPSNPSHADEVAARVAPIGGVYSGDTGRAALEEAKAEIGRAHV